MRACRIEQPRRPSCDLRQRASIGTSHRDTACHRLQHGETEPFIERGEDETCGSPVETFELLGRHPPYESDVGGKVEIDNLSAELNFVRRRVAGKHEHRSALVRDQRECFQQLGQVLMRAFCRECKDDGAVVEGVARPYLVGAMRCRGSGCPHSFRHNVDLPAGYAKKPHEVVTRAVRRGNDPVRAAGREWDEHAHRQGAEPEVRLGIDAIDHVMDRHHPSEGAPRGRGAGEAVQEVNTASGCKLRKKLLLTAHPLGATAGKDRNGHGRYEVVPRAFADLRSLAVDECRQPNVRTLLEECRDQLARIRLHPAGLAGDEIHEVQADVHEIHTEMAPSRYGIRLILPAAVADSARNEPLSSDDRPIVTVVTPSYNQGRYVRETIQSVLAQDYPRIEYVVIDGGSSDETLDILQEYGSRFEWVSKPDRGQASAVNEGWRQASGEILGWLNSDDLYLPGAVTTAVTYLMAHPEADAVYGEAYESDEAGTIVGRHPTQPFSLERMAETNTICQPAVFLRRRILERVGELDESLHFSMDYDFWIRLGKVGRFGYVPEYLAMNRLHGQTKTLGRWREAYSEVLPMIHRHFGYVPVSWIYGYAKESATAGERRRGLRLPLLRFTVAAVRAFRRYNRGRQSLRALRWRGAFADARAALRRRRTLRR